MLYYFYCRVWNIYSIFTELTTVKSGLNEDPESSVGISISSTKTIDTQGPDIENTEKSSEEKPVEKSKIQLYINHYLTF